MNKDIKFALATLKSMPNTKNETFVILSAATLVSAGAKLGYIKKSLGYGIVKPTISKLVTYFLETGYNLFDALYYDIVNKCIYINCLGMQFSYHFISETDEILRFANSEKNQVIEFERIYKQPKALGLFRLSNECLTKKISDPEYIRKRFDALDLDFPNLLIRHIGENTSQDEGKINFYSVLSTKYKVTNLK